MNGIGPGKICVSAHIYFQFGCLYIATLLFVVGNMPKPLSQQLGHYY